MEESNEQTGRPTSRESLVARIMARLSTRARGEPAVIVVHGGLGSGKTTLLQQLLRRCHDAGITTRFVHGALATDPSGRTGEARLLRPISELCPGEVLLVDGLEHVDRGRREVIETASAMLPPGAMVVATRCGEPPEGTASPMVEVISMPALSRDESAAIAEQHGVRAADVEGVVDAGAGNPLRLSAALAAYSRAGGTLPDRELASEIRRAVVDRVCPCHLSPARVAALDLVALVPVMSRELGHAILGDGAGGESWDATFGWLRERGYVAESCRGLRLDDHVRFPWREAAVERRKARLRELEAAARAFYADRLQTGDDWECAVSTLLYLARDEARFRPVVPARNGPSHYVTTAARKDLDRVVEVVAATEGSTGAAAVRAAFAVRPGIFELCSDAGDDVVAVLGMFQLPRDRGALDAAAAAGDTASQVVTEHLATQPLGAAQAGLVVRWCLSVAGHHRRATPAAVRQRVGQRLLVTPWLARAYQLCDSAGRGAIDCSPGCSRHVSSISVGDQQCSVVVHDFSQQPLGTLLGAAAGQPPPATSRPPQRPVLGPRQSLEQMVEDRLEHLAEDAGLTPREREVLHLLVLGRNAEEIAIALGVRPRTAKFHQSNVLAKLGLDSRLELFRTLL